MTIPEMFRLDGRVAVITGGAGLLGVQHAEAIAQAGGIPVLLDLSGEAAEAAAARLRRQTSQPVHALQADITDLQAVRQALDQLQALTGRVDILINNAANNPKAENTGQEWSRFESFSWAQWQADLDVGLGGAFICSQVFGTAMAQRGQGVIVNVASDLAIIAPDQRLYRKPGLPEDQQPVKPVSYSVVKTGLLGLTRYLATYWADKGVRVNALSPGGVSNHQPEAFVQLLASRIPLGRMAFRSEYQGAIVFLCSDASSYMTGANLVLDGGRTIW